MERGKFLDIVVCGPDMSGTNTQIKGLVKLFQSKGMKVRDLRGTEIDALFHTSLFKTINKNYFSYAEFFTDKSTTSEMREKFLGVAAGCLIGGGTNQDLRVASMMQNKVTSYIDPNSADV